MTKIMKAISKRDIHALTTAIYDAKTKKFGDEKTKKEMQKLIFQAEEVIVQLSG